MWIFILLGVCTFAASSSLDNNNTAPRLPRQFRLSLESINIFTERGRFIKTYYDLDNNLYRVDLDARNTEPPRIGKGPVTDIRNFTSGVAYRYSSAKKKCAKYDSPNCTAKLFVTTSVNNWRISTPCGLLRLYEDPDVINVYAGNQTVRNTLCDVWTSTRKNWPEGRPGELVFKWFTLRNPWMYNYQKQIPLRLEVDGQVEWNSTVNATIAFRVSFFAFETNYWTDDFFKPPEICLSSGGGDVEESPKMYTKKYVVRVAAVSGVVCIAVSMLTCGLYNFLQMKKAKKDRFY